MRQNLYNVDTVQWVMVSIIVCHKHTHKYHLSCFAFVMCIYFEFSTEWVVGCFWLTVTVLQNLPLCVPQKEPQGSFPSLVWAEECQCHVVCEQPKIVSCIQLMSFSGRHPALFWIFIWQWCHLSYTGKLKSDHVTYWQTKQTQCSPINWNIR